MRIADVFDQVFNESVGWRPTSGSIKPVHIANGMFRALSGRRHDISGLIDFLVPHQAGGALDPARSFGALVAGDPDGPFGFFADDETRFDELREFSRAVLGADRAIWPSAAKSSLTLTCAQMISADDNDRGMGAFAATVIGGADPEAPLANLVRQALEAGETDDPLSTLAWPLLNQTQTEVPRRVSAAVTSLQVHAPDYLAALREASACLATHEASQGNRLRTLQRAVHFACLTAQSHAQALVAGGDLEARPPALIAFRSHKNAPLTLASEASLSQIYDAFEAWLRSVLAERLRTGQPLHGAETIDPALVAPEANADRLSAVVLGLGGAGRGQGPLPDRLRDARLDDLREGLSYFPSDRADALAHALWNIYRRENTSGGPREFLQRIGRWSGLIYPHFQGASREKRIRPSIAILDLLARSCVAAGESIPLDAFLERLWRRFGLIVGGRGDGRPTRPSCAASTSISTPTVWWRTPRCWSIS